MADKRHSGDAARRGRWWIVHQHDQVTVVEAGEKPDKKVEKGQRLKTIRGPFETDSAARAAAEEIQSRTLKGKLERARG